MHWREQECVEVMVGKPGGEQLEGLDVYGRIILKWM
jgi:hypothetical protein